MPIETYGGKSKFLLVEGFQEPQMYYMKHEAEDGWGGGSSKSPSFHVSALTHTHTHILSLSLSLSLSHKVGRHNS